jgi:hypothetical protein
VRSVDFHLDLTGLDFDPFGDGDGEDTVGELCGDAVAIGIFGEGEAAGEAPVAAFDKVVASGVAFPFELPFAFHGEHSVADDDFDVSGGNVRQFGGEVVALLIFRDIDRRAPGAGFAGTGGVAEDGVGQVEKAARESEFAEGIVGIHGWFLGCGCTSRSWLAQGEMRESCHGA